MTESFRVAAWRGPFSATVRVALLCLCLLPATGCIVFQPPGKGRLELRTESTTGRSYWLYLPAEYVAADDAQRAERRWPVVCSFHGMKPFDRAHSQALEWQQEADRYGYIVVAPELLAPDVVAEFPVRRIHEWFKSDEIATVAALEEVFRNTRADRSNVLSTSWSSGGYLAHYMFNRYPGLFTCLAVRQSNFSQYVLDSGMCRYGQYSPVLIVNTEHDVAVCKEESRQAVEWYTRNGYRNIAWIYIKHLGHERTPDLAADFFSRVAQVQPNRPPQVLARRQAIDGNPEGIALLAGKLSRFEARPTEADLAAASTRTLETPPRPGLPQREVTAESVGGDAAGPPNDTTFTAARGSGAALGEPTPPRALGAGDAGPRRILSIRATPRTGIDPHLLTYAAECPIDWHNSAQFEWTLNGEPIGSGVNGQKVITAPGEHTLGLRVRTSKGEEHTAETTIRVFARLSSARGG